MLLFSLSCHLQYFCIFVSPELAYVEVQLQKPEAQFKLRAANTAEQSQPEIVT